MTTFQGVLKQKFYGQDSGITTGGNGGNAYRLQPPGLDF